MLTLISILYIKNTNKHDNFYIKNTNKHDDFYNIRNKKICNVIGY